MRNAGYRNAAVAAQFGQGVTLQKALQECCEVLKWSEGQARVPAGSPGGGQWAATGGMNPDTPEFTKPMNGGWSKFKRPDDPNGLFTQMPGTTARPSANGLAVAYKNLRGSYSVDRKGGARSADHETELEARIDAEDYDAYTRGVPNHLRPFRMREQLMREHGGTAALSEKQHEALNVLVNTMHRQFDTGHMTAHNQPVRLRPEMDHASFQAEGGSWDATAQRYRNKAGKIIPMDLATGRPVPSHLRL